MNGSDNRVKAGANKWHNNHLVITLVAVILVILWQWYLPRPYSILLSIFTILLGSGLFYKGFNRRNHLLAGGAERQIDALTKASAFQQSILDGIAEPIMVIDANYQVILINRAARDFYGITAKIPPLSFCYQMSHRCELPCEGHEHPCPLLQVRQGDQFVTVIHKHFDLNNEPRFVEVVAAPYRSESGEFLGIIESMRDITERKKKEEELQQYAERLRSMSAQLNELEEVERQRLSQELHDAVGQNLTALGINLNIIRSQIANELTDPVQLRISDSLALVDKTTEQIRNVMADLRPPVLDDYGLLAALNWYAERFAWRTNIQTKVDGEELIPRPASQIENTLFRIAQEALINAAKHAQAEHINISLVEENNIVNMVISDDGIGFDVDQVGIDSLKLSWGLINMADRAEAAGGNFSISSSTRQGTVIKVTVRR